MVTSTDNSGRMGLHCVIGSDDPGRRYSDSLFGKDEDEFVYLGYARDILRRKQVITDDLVERFHSAFKASPFSTGNSYKQALTKFQDGAL
jgi:hypothetical protein